MESFALAATHSGGINHTFTLSPSVVSVAREARIAVTVFVVGWVAVTGIRALFSSVRWYGGINLNCSIVDTATDFYIRTYSSHHHHLSSSSSSPPCVPANGSARGVSCHSDVYDHGELSDTC
ncbi:hypothetical protein VPNG_03494 [Cytospora leucostoma]|uniref:Uncharacterized protein n=1 Tax=Cytospora leucostoma TaxID=1230097 RepID=A0A423XCI7_9PEZI|nr:hypothetical protein VPNG_03494 [Cytospora leucostoma]